MAKSRSKTWLFLEWDLQFLKALSEGRKVCLTKIFYPPPVRAYKPWFDN